MNVQLNNVNPDQLQGLRNNFESNLVITESEDHGKFNVSFDLNNEIDLWKLFFSGSDYCLAKFGKHVTS